MKIKSYRLFESSEPELFDDIKYLLVDLSDIGLDVSINNIFYSNGNLESFYIRIDIRSNGSIWLKSLLESLSALDNFLEHENYRITNFFLERGNKFDPLGYVLIPSLTTNIEKPIDELINLSRMSYIHIRSLQIKVSKLS